MDDWRAVSEIFADYERRVSSKAKLSLKETEAKIDSLARSVSEQIQQGRIWVAEYNGILCGVIDSQKEIYSEKGSRVSESTKKEISRLAANLRNGFNS